MGHKKHAAVAEKNAAIPPVIKKVEVMKFEVEESADDVAVDGGQK